MHEQVRAFLLLHIIIEQIDICVDKFVKFVHIELFE